ncbi:hypothetical protein SAMD00019534_078730 [Acytostelium subglobosum LB1]|uniref:hypothetical protein n=1 Tax=Acytostelium subglobosum LB1 TaxID=1410327 RepID=UPI000644EBF5|nr:hypothetical protein SAMD00019534_078730 [Acytostelium subglobosum LB1]GAM24698.1 hypothetical protein SAMD00019534_078730 [Acytostelium subglobosum LB1]|eukprot:XP_012752367.1 hypothetical protein SAMD00019534_078730 [Acytostelium subglobosum LB1]
MELHVMTNTLDYEVETLSGRKISVHSENNERVGALRQRIASEYEYDGEVGSDFTLLHEGRELADDDVVTESLVKDTVQIRRTTYSCLVEHIIAPFPTWQKWVARVGCVIFAAFFISALAQVSFYLPHDTDRKVPVTLQTLAVFLIGSLLGWKMGPLAIIVYMIMGLAGAPFFAKHAGGYKVLYGASSGYLYGFILAAFIVGFMAERGNDRVYAFRWRSSLIAMLLGEVAIYVIGVPVLAKYVGWNKCIQLGLTPFLVGDVLKIIIAAVLIPLIWKLLAFIFNRQFTFKAGVALFKPRLH